MRKQWPTPDKLTLFKPWRALSDLKTNNQSWDSAFSAHEFTERHARIIQNFNLRYECLDARDDYKNEKARNSSAMSVVAPRDDEGCDIADEYGDHEFNVCDQDGDYDFDVPGNAYRRELECKRDADAVMNSSGWLYRGASVRRHDLARFLPDTVRTHGEWASIVKGERARLFKDRLSGYVPPKDVSGTGRSYAAPEVCVKSSDYLLKNYRSEKARDVELTDRTSVQFSLNEEQERAFRIIANHSSSLAPVQLKMYLGGMGGTGKSQVIKSVISFFKMRGESHRFIVLGPTGTSAALLGGSTYHSALGIHSRSEKGADYSRNEGAVINKVRGRLQGVQYIFIDEISMVSCRELYSISQRLSQVFNTDTVFGGVNIILAGDFAQLPPVGNLPFYSPQVSCIQQSGMRPSDQEAMLGKVFWHQFTTVVILKQNMRQRSQSAEDSKLRTALENMRYASCSKDDIDFLNSRVADKLTIDGKPILAHPDFRNVSVITAWNSQKDRFNEQGSARFAADNGQELVTFYSIDSLSSQENSSKRKKARRGVVNTRTPRRMSDKLQTALWGCSPCSCDHVASKLSVCVGLPVLIRNNDATELCITKGQEAVVVGWDSSDGPMGKPVLNTLFVRLTRPPQTVTLPGLPLNVVPIPRASTKVNCVLKSGAKVAVQRQQVLVLPNFAMTDYSSQGKTREFNVVHMEHCRDHMSYYTCLSRSASAAGTVLMQKVDPAKICRGISGHLRQEFRELNILDIVTAMNYNGKLPGHIIQPLRNPTVRNYMLWSEGSSYDSDWHETLAYSVGESRLKKVESDATWDPAYLENRKISGNTIGKRRRGAIADDEVGDRPNRNVRTNMEGTLRSPRGFVWDSSNYSCAYDSVFSVLYNVWSMNPRLWGRRLGDISAPMMQLCASFSECDAQLYPLERARDAVRSSLTAADPVSFPTGSRYTYLYNLVSAMMGSNKCGTADFSCSRCGYLSANNALQLGELINLVDVGVYDRESRSTIPISEVLNAQLCTRSRRTGSHCGVCKSLNVDTTLDVSVSIERVPYMIWVELCAPVFSVDTEFAYDRLDLNFRFRLAGVVYGGQGHFVCRFIDLEGTVWFNDGMTTGSLCDMDFRIDEAMDASDVLRYVDVEGRRKEAIYAVYIRD